MTAVGAVIGRARRLSIPSDEETDHVKAVADAVLSKTREAAVKFPQTRGVLLGGSFAKGTWVAGHVDLDVFVRFDPSTPEGDFERIGLEIGAAATAGHPQGKKFAQHPYTEATVDGVRVNIVPCFAVPRGGWKSAADRSPFHVELIEKLPDGQKAEVRLLKTFMNAVGVYGAEIQRQGFSGYVAEVLVLKHGSLANVLEWFGRREVGQGGRPFSLRDPVDEGRDLGIAVSGESLGRMVLASREFLRRPHVGFFRAMSGRARTELRKDVVAVVFAHAKLSEDTLWGELRKTSNHIARHLEVSGFKIARSMAASDNERASAILLVPEFTQLPKVEQRVGPTVDRERDVRAFLKANSGRSRLVWVDDDARVRMLVPRDHTRLAELLTDVVRGSSGPVGASHELEAGMKKSAKVLQGKALLQASKSKEWLRNGIREITTDAVGTR